MNTNQVLRCLLDDERQNEALCLSPRDSEKSKKMHQGEKGNNAFRRGGKPTVYTAAWQTRPMTTDSQGQPREILTSSLYLGSRTSH